MTRREIFINVMRVALLQWRVMRGVALPSLALALLQKLDAWAKRLERRA